MPRLSSELQERASGPQRTTAPKTKPIMVAGPASRGPTGEVVEIEDEDDAFQFFGTDGPLAFDIAAVLRGARVGSQAADNRRFGRVKAVRTETGEPAKLTLTDGNGNPVLEMETASSGEQSNDWSVVEQNNTYHIDDPENEAVTSFAVDSTAIGVEDTISTPSQLATAIRQTFGGRLKAEAKEHEAHFEVSLDSDVVKNGPIGITSNDSRTTIDFSGVTNSEMESNSSGSTTWLGGKNEYFSSPSSTMKAHRRVLAPDNTDARIYAITAGSPVVAPTGNETVTVPNLADASVVGVGDTNTLLNIRTSGTGGTPTPLPLTDTAKRDGSVVSEGYFRARRQYAGRLDVTETVQKDMMTGSAKAASQNDFDLSGLPSSSVTIDGVSLSQGDQVLLKAQDDSAENGLYEAVDASGDLDLSLLQGEQELTDDKIEINNGTDSGKVFTFDAGSGEFVEPKAIKITFDAPAGIADDGGSLSTSYATWKTGNSGDAGMLSSNRLTGENTKTFVNQFGKAVKLEMAPAANEDDVREIQYSTSGYDADDKKVSAELSWSDGTAELLLDKSEFTDLYGSELDDGFVFFSYDSCITDLTEVASENQLDPDSDQIEYTVDEFEVTFNQELPHDLVMRGLQIHQYRLGEDVQLERTDTGNKFIFTDSSAQPGEGSGKIGDVETIVGFDYTFEPDFPAVPTEKTFSGGSTGINASDQKKADALDEALKELPSEDFAIIVPSGLTADAMKTSNDPVTGQPSEEPVDVIGVLEDHRDRQDFTGASGVSFLNVTPMTPSTASGAYSTEQKRSRAQEIIGTGGTGEITTGSIVQDESRPQFYFFDAPMAVSLGGQTRRMGSAAFFAGVRAALPTDTALYEVELPTDLYQPLYRYDVENQLPERLGNEGRVNTWDVDTGELALATEVTGAGEIQSASGELAESNLKSGVVMFATQNFRKNLEDQLSNLIGGMQAGGIETLRATADSLIQATREQTTGVVGLRDFEPQRDIQIKAEGGSSIGLRVKLQAIVMGELTRIDLTVGSITETQARNQNQNSPIPRAQ